MPGGRNTRKRSGRGRGAVESGGKRLRSSKGTDEAVEILQFGSGNHGDPDSHTSNSEGNAKQPTHPANLDTSSHPRANFVDFEQIIRDLDISLQTSGRSQTSETNPNVLNIPSNTQESFNLTRGEETLRLGGEDMSAHVPLQLCQKIWAHQYINIALLLKGNVELQDLCSGGILHITDKGQLESRPRITKDKVPTIDKWTDAFLIFSSIYLKKYPNKTQELLQYMSIIREAANRSSLSWRTYDEQFHLRQATNVQPWGRLNSDLWLRVMTTNNYQSQTESYVNRAACLDFNNGYCSFIHCKFTHACSNCGGTNHGRQTCFKLTSPNVNKGGPAFRRPRGFHPYARVTRPFPRRGNRQ